MLMGPNLALSVELAQASGAEVIVSGGVAGTDDVVSAGRAGGGIVGVIVGKAIYEGRVDLADAVRRARG
jgi:phosphoribosylformimino-5-aminoimidazole carboxamide ribonucleotide (ProFAR) isomerase